MQLNDYLCQHHGGCWKEGKGGKGKSSFAAEEQLDDLRCHASLKRASKI